MTPPPTNDWFQSILYYIPYLNPISEFVCWRNWLETGPNP